MQTKIFPLLIVALLITITSFAQTGNNQSGSHTPVVTKGYYSIGDNARKLQSATFIEATPSADTSAKGITKGYYTIGKNSDKISSSFNIKVKRKAAPVVHKGYYSIGNNAEKL